MSSTIALQLIALIVVVVVLFIVILREALYGDLKLVDRFYIANRTKYRVKTVKERTTNYYPQIKLNMFVPWATIEINDNFQYEVYYGTLPATGFHEKFAQAEEMCKNYKRYSEKTNNDQKVVNTIVCEDDNIN